ncbi:hypothetical protein KQI86_19335 [Clostridium sp. MSJ-11]|uniref:Uncharacterized protein n=1 Tax=Clostridium mobile TaxID=2841512 RepID=A0ABS6EMK1_9CLOT|nr:hypothetical protein [Clostridium mobile]MBU5486458.1 hypothetical protein [Clostridium mobile]
MKTTANYGLKKPDGTDVVNIDDLNYNADVIDTKIKEIDTKASNIKVPVTSVNGKTGAVSLSAADVGAVPTGRKVNSKALSADITLSATDIKTSSGATIESELAQMAKDYVRNPGYGKTAGTSTAYTLTLSPAPSSYVDGLTITIIPHVDCGDNPTLNINNLGAIQLVNSEGNNLKAGELKANKPYSFVRVGSNFFIRSSGGCNAIKSIQSGEYYFQSDIANANITISTVDFNKSVVIIEDESSVDRTTTYFMGQLFNNNTLNIQRNNGNAYGAATVYWRVIEFDNIKSVQQGVISSTQFMYPIPINRVNVSKTLAFASFKTTDLSNISYVRKQLVVSESNLVIRSRTESKVWYWYVVEFN